MKMLKSLRGLLRRKSVFYKTLALLTALTVITITIFIVVINHLLLRHQKKNIDDLSLLQLQRVGSNVERVFDLLAQNLAGNIAGGLGPPDETGQSAQVTRLLHSYVEGNSLVRRAYCYLPSSGRVAAYDGSDEMLAHFADRGMVETYLAADRDERAERWRVLLHHRRIILAARSDAPDFDAILFLEINRAELYKIIQAENADFDTTIYVYDPNRQLLFDYMAGGLQPADFDSEDLFLSAGGNRSKQSYYRYTSEALGWSFLTKIRDEGAAISRSTLWGLLPVFLVYIVLSQLFALYITNSIYRPINRLMQIAAGPARDSLNWKQARNEVDYLELSFQNTVDQNEQHRALMRTVSEDILEQLLRGILTGRSVDAHRIRDTLEGIGQGPLTEGRFLVLVGLMSFEQDELPGSVQVGLYQRSILQLFGHPGTGGARITAFFIDRDTVAAVLHFAHDRPAMQIGQAVLELRREIDGQMQELPFRMDIGKGRVYNNITSLQFSYHEALDDARYSRYIEKSSGESRARPGSDNTSYEGCYYSEQVRKLIHLAEKGDLQVAVAAMEALIDELFARGNVHAGSVHRLLDDFSEHLIARRITQQELLDAGASVDAEVLSETDPLRQREVLQSYCTRALHLIDASCRRSNNRYATQAKEYVVSHYMQGSLSLAKISDALGISAPYLSAVFAETAGEGFNAYLNNYRITQARRFLAETNLNISEIGYKCGFNSAQNFSRVFKKNTGMTPKQFREHPRPNGRGMYEDTL